MLMDIVQDQAVQVLYKLGESVDTIFFGVWQGKEDRL